MALQRSGGRKHDALRPVRIETDVMKFAEGSALVRFGDTQVLVSATVENRLPPFRLESGEGWVTAEYSMLPRATHTRSGREVARGRVSGRTAEIQRLIGRSLRAVVDMASMPNLTLTVDCDVLQADGGTRTAAVTGGYVAMASALARLYLTGDLADWPLRDSVAAISVGVVKGEPMLDLDYAEDLGADVDMNVVATGSGELVEVQGTGEGRSFRRAELDALLDLALDGIGELTRQQQEALAERLAEVGEVRSRGRRPRVRAKDEGELWGPPT